MEESGWTSYLDTECSVLSVLSESSYDHNSMSSAIYYTNDNFQVSNTLQDREFGRHHNVVAQNGNTCDELQAAGCSYERRAGLMAFPDEESCGSSTLSDANSSLGCPSQKHTFSSTNQHAPLKRKRQHKVAAISKDHLADTATSSPSSNQDSKCRVSDVFASDDWNSGEGGVSKRFKVLEALIPCLREMAGKANEEEMLNAIISHVRALELKVKLLSDVWRLSRVKHG